MCGELARWILSQIAEFLEVDVGTLDSNQKFRDYGVDSTIALALVKKLEDHLGHPIAATLPWHFPSAAQLAQSLLAGHEDDQLDFSKNLDAVCEPVAVLGIGCRFPGGANSPDSFFDVLKSGMDTTGVVPKNRWDSTAWHDENRSTSGKMIMNRGAFLDRVDLFDAAFWEISPREAMVMDPQQRMFMEVTWEALEDAGIVPEAIKDSTTGVFVGAMWHDYALLRGLDPHHIAQHTLVGQDLSIIPARVSYALGLRGPSLTVNTACSSSLVAIHLACTCLQQGEADTVIAGGVNLMLAPHSSVALSKFGGLAPDGRCKTFDASADGYGRGEGCGVVILKTLSRALCDGDKIYSLIRGSSMNNDGASNGLTAPSPVAQIEVLNSAWSRAGLYGSEAAYVEAHGTGTKLGDPIEADAISNFFGRGRPNDRPLRVGSVKTNIGHLEAAAGIAALIKVSLSLKNGILPGSLHFKNPNPHIDFEALKMKVQTQTEDWPEETFYTGVSSFGIGGTNCHVVMDAPPGYSTRPLKRFPFKRSPKKVTPRLVFVYSGYGSQWIGMGQQLLYQEPTFRQALMQCDKVFRSLLDVSVAEEICSPPHLSKIGPSALGQILVFSIQVALKALLESWNVVPQVVIGQSIGEIAAAYHAGILTLEDAARVIAAFAIFGRKMDSLGGMAVVGLSQLEVQPILKGLGGTLCVGGYLGPKTTVLAGDLHSLESLLPKLREKNILALRVNIGYACHSWQMASCLDEMKEYLKDVKTAEPIIPMMSTCNVGYLTSKEAHPQYWVNVFRKPAQFYQGIKAILEKEHAIFLEISPHPVLKRSISDTISELDQSSSKVFGTCWREENDRDNILGALNELGDLGVPVDWNRVEEKRARSPQFESLNQKKLLHLVTLSSKNVSTFSAVNKQMRQRILAKGRFALGDLAFTLAVKRTHFPYRQVFLASSIADLHQQLENADNTLLKKAGSPGPTAFLFTGQGSQYPEMSKVLYDRFPIFRKIWDKCASYFDSTLEQPLKKIAFAKVGSPNSALLNETLYTQTSLFAHQIATFHLWRSWGVQPSAVIGHSLGELAAACSVGVMSLKDGCLLTATRAKLMSLLPKEGAMVVVEVGEKEVLKQVEPYKGSISIAAVNGPRQVVISGDAKMVGMVAGHFQREGVKTQKLMVSHAFHSHLMEPVLTAFREVAQSITFSRASVPLVSNLDGQLTQSTMCSPEYWVKQIRQTVKYYSGIQTLCKAGYKTLVEMGPAPVLLNMAVNCFSPEDKILLLPSMRKGKRDERVILESLAQWHLEGGYVNWKAFFSRFFPHQIDLPTYPFQGRRFWLDSTVHPKDSQPNSPASKEHPFLGNRIKVGGKQKKIIFNSYLSKTESSHMEDYRVFQEVLLPATACLEMIHAARKGVLEAFPILLEKVTFGHHLLIPEEGDVQIQLILEAKGLDSWRFEIYSNPKSEEDVFELHAGGSISAHVGKPPPITNLTALKERMGEEKDPEEFYWECKRRGIDYGLKLQTISRLWVGDGEALGNLQVLEHLLAEIDVYTLNPALLKGCLQVAMSAAPGGEFTSHFYLKSLGKFTIYRSTGHDLWCHVRVKMKSDILTAEMDLYTNEGEAIGHLSDLIFEQKLEGEEKQFKNWLYETAWLPQKPSRTLFEGPEASEGCILVIGSSLESHQLASTFQSEGDRCYLATANKSQDSSDPFEYYFSPEKPELCGKLLASLLAARHHVKAVVFLTPLEITNDDLSQNRFKRIFDYGCGGMLNLIQEIQEKLTPSPPTLILITRGAQTLDQNIGLSGLAQSPLWGMSQAVSMEHPDLNLKCIDLDPSRPQNEISLLSQEIRRHIETKSKDSKLIWRDDIAYVQRLRRIKEEMGQKNMLERDATYLITGGLGDLGLSLAQFFVDLGATHLVLTSRNLPSPRAQNVIEEMETRGTHITVACADVAQKEQVTSLVESILENHPPFRGLFHMAGILDDGILARLTPDRFQKVLRPKILGSWYLHEATKNLNLDHFVMFSSIASILGSAGQANYAAGNAFLDALVHLRAKEGLSGLTVNWGVFNMGMAEKAGAFAWEARGIEPFTTEQAWRILSNIPNQISRIAVVRLKYAMFSRRWREDPFFEEVMQKEKAEEINFAKQLEAAPVHQHVRLLKSHLRQQLGLVLGFEPNDVIDPQQGFTNMGMDSLAAVDFRNFLQLSLGCALPSTLVFDYPNLDSLEKYLINIILTREESEPEPSIEKQGEPFEEEEGDLESLIDAELEELQNLGFDL